MHIKGEGGLYKAWNSQLAQLGALQKLYCEAR